MPAADVTVVIPNYNRVRHLRRALVSILSQGRVPNEILVVDDCSDAGELKLIEAVVEELRLKLDIRLLYNRRNMGANYSRNRGIRAASSRYIAFLDSDDVWMPNKLDSQMTAIGTAARLDARPILSATGRYRVDDGGEVIARQHSTLKFTLPNILSSNFIGTLSSVVVDTAIARQIGGFKEGLSACQDWEFFIRLAGNVQYVGIPDPLCVYFDHKEARISKNLRKRIISHAYLYKCHLKNYYGPGSVGLGNFYRVVAEDLQGLGKYQFAKSFYASFRALQSSGLTPPCFWSSMYNIVPLPDLREKRYEQYRASLLQILKDPVKLNSLREDQATIKRLMVGDGNIRDFGAYNL